MQRLPIIVAILALAGCNTGPHAPEAGFERVDLNGADLASLLQMHCANYTYNGPDKWCYWRLAVVHYGPDDEVVRETYLGGGGTRLRAGQSFICSIPVFKGGTAAVRFFGMNADEEIDPLLPQRQTDATWGWNPNVPFHERSPMVLAVFAVDTQSPITFPNDSVPRGHGGHVAVVQLELLEGEPGAGYPWPDRAIHWSGGSENTPNPEPTPAPR